MNLHIWTSISEHFHKFQLVCQLFVECSALMPTSLRLPSCSWSASSGPQRLCNFMCPSGIISSAVLVSRSLVWVRTGCAPCDMSNAFAVDLLVSALWVSAWFIYFSALPHMLAPCRCILTNVVAQWRTQSLIKTWWAPDECWWRWVMTNAWWASDVLMMRDWGTLTVADGKLMTARWARCPNPSFPEAFFIWLAAPRAGHPVVLCSGRLAEQAAGWGAGKCRLLSIMLSCC